MSRRWEKGHAKPPRLEVEPARQHLAPKPVPKFKHRKR